MKARVKATGECVEVAYLSEDKYGNKYYKVTTDTRTYLETELEMMSDKGDYFYTYDYWARLEHQYAGMAMQGILSNPVGFESIRSTSQDCDKKVAEIAICFAKELVKGLKLERSN